MQRILTYILETCQVKFSVCIKTFTDLHEAFSQLLGVIKRIYILKHIRIEDPVDQFILVLKMIVKCIPADVAVVGNTFYRNF